jgi:hypothetical protein
MAHYNKTVGAMDIEIAENVTGEYLLWVAIVDRAIWDFCTFADWYCQRLSHEYGRKRKQVSNTAEVAMLREYNVLSWFLFSERSEEFNLQWIAEHVFKCGDSICGDIRKRCEAGHKANLDVYATNERLDKLVEMYEQRTHRKVTPTDVDKVDIRFMARPRIRRVNRY